MIDHDKLWRHHARQAGLLKGRPDYRFDPVYYGRRYPDVVAAGLDPQRHYAKHGKPEKRVATEYQELVRQVPDLDHQLAAILTEPELQAAIRRGEPGAAELAYELLALPGDLDIELSGFSQRHYRQSYPEVADAGLTPIRHYLAFGRGEGRSSLATLRRNRHDGGRSFDATRPTLLLAVPDLDEGAPFACARDLLRDARETHNVVVVSLRERTFTEQIRQDAVAVFVTNAPHEEIEFALADLMPQVEYALLISADCSPFIKMLVGRRIPFASYISEDARYLLPPHKTMFPAFFADLMVFATEGLRDTWRDVHEDLGFDTERDSCVVAPVRDRGAPVSAAEHAAARDRLAEVLGCDVTGRKLVCGRGPLHWQSGADLFFLAAQIARETDPESVYVWIGDGPGRDDADIGIWMHRHQAEAGALHPTPSCYCLPAGPLDDVLIAAADVVFVPARSGEMQAAISEALDAACDVVTFETTPVPPGAQDRLHSVGFGRADMAARTIAALPRKQDRPALPCSSIEDSATRSSPFHQIETRLRAQLDRPAPPPPETGEFDVSLLFSARPVDAPYRAAERYKAWALGRRTVWPSPAAAQAALHATDHPALRAVSIRPYTEQAAADLPPYSIHLHAHYTDDLEQDLRSHLAFHSADRLVITTDTLAKSNMINGIVKSVGLRAEIVETANQGRDILPFLQLFRDVEAEGGSDIWAHVHQKKSTTTEATGDIWRAFLLRILLGGPDHLSNALPQMHDPQVGLVSPLDPFICGWFRSKPVLPLFQRQLPVPLPRHPTVYPVGNMFWTRRGVIDQMNGYFGPSYPWPNEPLPDDGTVFHVIERLWPVAAQAAGFTSVFLSKPDQRRR